MIDGNVNVALKLSSTGIRIDQTCRAIVDYVSSLLVVDKASASKVKSRLDRRNGDASAGVDGDFGEARDVLKLLSPKALVAEGGYDAHMTAGGGFDLLQLLVEQMHLLPLNPEQLRSEPLWAMLGRVCSPAIRAVALVLQQRGARGVPPAASQIFEELVDGLHELVFALARLALLDDVLGDDAKREPMREIHASLLTVLNFKAALEDEKVLPKRTMEAVERIVNAVQKTAHNITFDLGAPNFSRKEVYALHKLERDLTKDTKRDARRFSATIRWVQ